jgi:beta-glucanase (GH16 family)
MNRIISAFAILIFLPGLLLAQAADVKSKSKLVWSDEFNYNGLPDTTKWVYEEGFVRNQEPQYYTIKRLENCRVENGCLVIETRKETYPNAAYRQDSTQWNKKEQFAQYTSASINTKGKESWKYGRMEIRAKVPCGLGSWPAFWMLGYNKGKVKWPECGEIDIMEFLGRDSAKVYGTVHYADASGQLRNEGKAPIVGKPADGFHVYAIDWDEKQISFYYDSLKYFVFDFNKPNGNPGKVFQKDFYLLLNMALGHQGSWAGPVDEKILPIKYYIDYVRVYQ